MSEFKNLADVLEVAIRIERQGIVLYNKLSAGLKSSKAKDTFSFLAAEEEKHAGVFRQMLQKIADYAPRFNYPGEYGLFIDEVASRLLDRIEKEIVSLAVDSENDALEIGIELEKETILFYMEIKSESKLNQEEGKMLQAVMDEERLHWQMLLSLKNMLKY